MSFSELPNLICTFMSPTQTIEGERNTSKGLYSFLSTKFKDNEITTQVTLDSRFIGGEFFKRMCSLDIPLQCLELEVRKYIRVYYASYGVVSVTDIPLEIPIEYSELIEIKLQMLLTKHFDSSRSYTESEIQIFFDNIKEIVQKAIFGRLTSIGSILDDINEIEFDYSFIPNFQDWLKELAAIVGLWINTEICRK